MTKDKWTRRMSPKGSCSSLQYILLFFAPNRKLRYCNSIALAAQSFYLPHFLFQFYLLLDQQVSEKRSKKVMKLENAPFPAQSLSQHNNAVGSPSLSYLVKLSMTNREVAHGKKPLLLLGFPLWQRLWNEVKIPVSKNHGDIKVWLIYNKAEKLI